METVICNLCGHPTASPYATVPDLLLARPDVTATLVQCSRCGLVYQNPRPTLAEIGQHYPPEYESYTDHVAEKKRNPLLQWAIDYGINKRCRYVTRHKQSGTLLDIGCAAGTFLVGMRNHSENHGGTWQLQGVELTADVARIARERHGLDVFTGTLEEAAHPDNTFDAITLWDVLEHLHDPAASLREIRRILKPGGVLIIRVPNLASWDARLFGDTWAGLDAPRHLYIFSPATLSQTLEKAGFEVLSHSSGIGSYVTFVLSVRFWLTARGVAERTKETVSRLLYHPAARILSVPFFYIPSQLRRGPLIVTTARKPEAPHA